MFAIYDDTGFIYSVSSSRPGDIFDYIELAEDYPQDLQYLYCVIDGVITRRESPYIPPYNYVASRMEAYNIYHQLNLIVDDIESGIFGESAKTGKFMSYITEIKNKFPKT